MTLGEALKAYEAAADEYAADVEEGHRLAALNESMNNGAIREEKGEVWYGSPAFVEANNEVYEEMGILLPRTLDRLDVADALIAAQQAALAEREARVAALEAVIGEVRDTCQKVLDQPEAYRGGYTYVEYQPYEEILDIVDPPESDDPDMFDLHLAAYVEWVKMTAFPANLKNWPDWHDATYPSCNCRIFRRKSGWTGAARQRAEGADTADGEAK